MAIVDDHYIVAPTLSEAWLDAVAALLDAPNRKRVHLLARVTDPTREVDAIREGAQALIDETNRKRAENTQLPDVETTRNTIFPAHWARQRPKPADLAAYYRERYTKDGLCGFRGNERGTYFGRIVAYPRGNDEEPGDQLTDTVRKLRAEKKNKAAKSSRYEINIYNEARDTSPMSFPCLAHLSVHLHEGKLHMQAIYRNEHIVARGYGNFLGLAELQRYVADAAGLELGELLLTIGHAELDSTTKTAARQLLERLGYPR
jgi:thymidylate synthase